MITCPFCFSCFTSIKTSSDVARVSFGRPISAGDRDVVVVGGGGGGGGRETGGKPRGNSKDSAL